MAASANVARRCLPCATFLATFTIVMMILVMSMDMRVPRHLKSLNLSEDLNFPNVLQDDPQLITYIQAVYLRYPHNSDALGVRGQSALLPPLWTMLVAKLLHFKQKGMFVEAGAYHDGQPSDTEWLERKLGWHGLLIQPNPADYLTLRKHSRPGSYCLHACLSPTSYPKEVSVRKSSKKHVDGRAEQTEYLFSRVKCFPLYSLLLAINMTSVDYLSLTADGTELQVLKTIPMDQVSINLIGVKWHEQTEDSLLYFMASRQYRLERKFEQFYLFVHQTLKL